MKKSEQKKYEKLLLEKRAQLIEELGFLKKTSLDATAKDNAGDLSSYSYHMADQGTDTMEREKAFMFASKSGRLLYHIDEALRRTGNNQRAAARLLGISPFALNRRLQRKRKE